MKTVDQLSKCYINCVDLLIVCSKNTSRILVDVPMISLLFANITLNTPCCSNVAYKNFDHVVAR